MFDIGRPAAVVLALVAIPAGSAPARAQEPARLSVGAGAGIAAPLRVDFGFTAPAWEMSLRAAVTRHLMLEGTFSKWSRAESSVLSNVTLWGPGGVAGYAGRITQETRRNARMAHVNLLGRFAYRRFEFFAGGGGGLFTLSRLFRQTLSGCTSSIAGACQDSESSFASDSFAGQLVGGGDLHLTRRLSAFGLLRFSMPVADVGSSDLRVVTGLRVSVR